MKKYIAILTVSLLILCSIPTNSKEITTEEFNFWDKCQ